MHTNRVPACTTIMDSRKILEYKQSYHSPDSLSPVIILFAIEKGFTKNIYNPVASCLRFQSVSSHL